MKLHSFQIWYLCMFFIICRTSMHSATELHSNTLALLTTTPANSASDGVHVLAIKHASNCILWTFECRVHKYNVDRFVTINCDWSEAVIKRKCTFRWRSAMGVKLIINNHTSSIIMVLAMNRNEQLFYASERVTWPSATCSARSQVLCPIACSQIFPHCREIIHPGAIGRCDTFLAMMRVALL